MLRVKEEELNQRRKNALNRRRRYSDDYDSEAELYQKYKAAGGEEDNNMVGGESSGPVSSHKIPLGLSFSMKLPIVLSALLAAQWWKQFSY